MSSKILIIAASNDRNLVVSNEFMNFFNKEEITNQVLDLSTIVWPLFYPQNYKTDRPADLAKYFDLFDKAAGFIFCVPEYNAGLPPLLTNFITWLSVYDNDWRKCFNNKLTLLTTHSGSGGHNVLTVLRIQLAYLGMNIMGRQLLFTKSDEINNERIIQTGQLFLKNLHV